MSHSIFWDYFSVFVDRNSGLDIHRCDDCAVDLFDFIKWEGEGKTSFDVVLDEFQEEAVLLRSSFVISEGECVIDVSKSVFVVNWLEWSRRSVR